MLAFFLQYLCNCCYPSHTVWEKVLAHSANSIAVSKGTLDDRIKCNSETKKSDQSSIIALNVLDSYWVEEKDGETACNVRTLILRIAKFAISLLPHLAHQSTLLLSTSPFEPLTIILVLLRFAFNHLLSNVYFPFRNFSFKFLIFLLLKSSHPRTKFHSSILSLRFPRLHPPQLQKAVATTQILDVNQLVPKILQITQILLELSFCRVTFTNSRILLTSIL